MRAIAAVVAAVALAGCETERGDAYVMCHNANCSHTNPARDDTLGALHDSLALEEHGRSIIDGIELDLIWERRSARCVFEHDLADAAAAPDALQPVTELAAHLRRKGTDAAWNRERYFVKLELKVGAAPDGDAMTRPELERLADCALALTDVLEAAAKDAGLELTTFYESELVAQLRIVTERAGWRADLDGRDGRRRLAMNYSYDPPASLRPAIGVVTMNWRWARDGDYTTYQDLQDDGIELMMWMYDASEKALATVDHVEPTYIDTNEAPLFRSWLARD